MSDLTPKPRRVMIRMLLFVSVAAMIGFALVEGLHWWRHVDEPNAQVQVDFSLLSSSVNATVKTVHVRRGERVEVGALLASMDTVVAELDTATLEAEIGREQAARAEIEAELAQYHREMADKIVTAKSAIKLQSREHATWERRLTIAQANVVRNRKLASRRAITSRQMDDATERLLDVTSNLRSLETDIQTKRQELVELKNALKKEAVYQSRIMAIDQAVEKVKVQLRQAAQRLEEMHVRAPIAGVIDEIYVSPGVYVEDGDRAFLMHDPSALWLEAAVDESDIRLVQPGQSVRIEFDAYPFEYFQGKVRALGNATLGSMNDGGKETPDPRSAQRVQVLIDLPQTGKPVWPGMRASVNISVR